MPLDEDGDSSDVDRGKDNPGLSSAKSSKRLNQIDCVRANGVGDHIALPQLAVSGDQSAGKSSVLEGITGYPFPRKDGLCTQFPTEIVLRHDTQVSSMTASLLPSQSRSPEEKKKFAGFQREFQDFNELPMIIREASYYMGVRGFSELVDAPGFAADVLRLELVGNTGLHLTLVDLPGLISVSEDEEDVEIVQRLVDSYLESSRTIILAVIPASSSMQRPNALFNERVILTRRRRKSGSLGEKPGSHKVESWLLSRQNPSPDELVDGISFQQRHRVEMEFFSSQRWKAQGIDSTRIGMNNLRSFLEELLDSHIERELPKVQQEVRHLLQRVDDEIINLGIERSNATQVRVFLTQISTEFYGIVKNGLEGNYDSWDGDFFATGPETCRLRAAIHRENEHFAEYMRNHGQRRKVVASDCDKLGEESDEESEEKSKEESEEDKNKELLVTEKEMFSWIKEMYHQTRGRELPGNYNHSLLQRLFHIQSCRWKEISRAHIESVVSLVTQFVRQALKFVVKDAGVYDKLQKHIMTTFNENTGNAHGELSKLIQDERGHPITYNHYYTDNIQKARHDEAKESIRTSVKKAAESDWGGNVYFSNTPHEMNRMILALQKRVEVNMVDRACSEALTDLNAYYKVAMKTFVDNVCRQVIERQILSKLGGAFHPTVVSKFSDEDLMRLAGESQKTSRQRVETVQLKQKLEASLRELST
ncbi:Dynamin [Penicillium argentinense]|uniref:Dynamin n=1 Tax=Penicillium argentinense TaxID=1131581 RepID=A0A9W9KMD9_9EURO|nr:Dynamin [Penicillium argentinense]KAJ5110792.1 Dynamin [Penicillium argentinense]